jgi:membrane-bound ClpP family serine protease
MLDKLSEEFLQCCIEQYSKERNKQKIEEYIINPLIDFILIKLKPIILGIGIYFTLIVILVIIILILIVKQQVISNQFVN